MTKTNIALLEKLSTTPKGVKKWDKSQLEFITAMLEKATKSTPKADEHPPIMDGDEIIELWCNRHETYEPVDDFKYYDKTEKYHPACDTAVKQWNEYTKEIKKLDKMTMDIINKGEEVTPHIMKIESLKSERAGTYTYPESV